MLHQFYNGLLSTAKRLARFKKNTDFFISLAQNEECLSTKMKCTDTKI